MAWTAIHTFNGNPDWQELNELIKSEDGNEEPFFSDIDEYQRSVKEGFVTYDGRKTTVWLDDMGGR